MLGKWPPKINSFGHPEKPTDQIKDFSNGEERFRDRSFRVPNLTISCAVSAFSQTILACQKHVVNVIDVIFRYIWPWGKWNAVSHDAYTCLQFPRTRPFPTRRVENQVSNFVAAVVSANDVMRQECPYKCRPKDHKDWTFC